MGQLPILGIAILASLAIGFTSGWKVNSWKYGSERAIETESFTKAMELTAQEIAKIEVKNVTIKQQMETVVRENTVYRDCQHTPDGLQLINEALSGKSTSDSKLPGTGAAK